MDVDTVRGLVDAEMLSKYLNVSSCSILAYDIFLFLSEEISSIWTSSWSKMKILYLVLRYMPVLNLALVLSGQFIGGSPQMCSNLYRANIVVLFFTLCATRIITAYRSWILYDKSRRLRIWSLLFFGVAWMGVMATTGLSLRYVSFNPATGCIPLSSNPLISILFVNWALLVACDTAILLLMVVRWYTAFTISGQSRLRDIITKDGVLYFVLISLIPPINLIVIICLPLKYINLLSLPELILNCIIASRMVITTVQRKRDSRMSSILGYPM